MNHDQSIQETDTITGVDGRHILCHVGRYLASDSFPHEPENWETCEACAILFESLQLIANLSRGTQ